MAKQKEGRELYLQHQEMAEDMKQALGEALKTKLSPADHAHFLKNIHISREDDYYHFYMATPGFDGSPQADNQGRMATQQDKRIFGILHEHLYNIPVLEGEKGDDGHIRKPGQTMLNVVDNGRQYDHDYSNSHLQNCPKTKLSGAEKLETHFGIQRDIHLDRPNLAVGRIVSIDESPVLKQHIRAKLIETGNSRLADEFWNQCKVEVKVYDDNAVAIAITPRLSDNNSRFTAHAVTAKLSEAHDIRKTSSLGFEAKSFLKEMGIDNPKGVVDKMRADGVAKEAARMASL